MRFIALAVLSLPLAAQAAPSLSIEGECPGLSTIEITGLTPGGNMTMLFSAGLGEGAIPAGGCGGTITGLDPVRWAMTMPDVDGDGNMRFSPFMPESACGKHVQIMDPTDCSLSGIATIGEGGGGGMDGLYVADGRGSRFGGPYFLYHIDLDTGAVSEVGELDAGLTGLSAGPDGQMYAVQAEGRNNPNFYTLNLDTASLTYLSESSDSGSMSGFAWRGDELFAWTENGDDLGSVDLDSGTWTMRGVSGGSAGHCMATDAAGNMYRMSSGSLYLVTPDDGEVSLGGVSGGSFSSGGGACTFHEGVLYRNGSDEHLYAIDVATLVATDTGIVMSENIDAMGSFTP